MKVDFMALILVVVAGLVSGLYGVTKLNVLYAIHPLVNVVFCLLVGAAALWLVFKRDTYLPFLGTTVMPCPTLSIRTPEGANTTLEVKVKPNALVVFWASEGSAGKGPQEAYGGYANSGVTKSDARGVATLRVRRPVDYTAGGRRIPLHIHYRLCENGLMGRVETVYL